jgi:hypothetical protein
MLVGTSGLNSYVIDLSGDPVTINVTGSSTANTLLDTYILYTFPNPNYHVVSGRITAGGMAQSSVDSETYEIIRYAQNVQIDYATAYSGVPSGQSFSSPEYPTNYDLSVGVPLTSDITLYGPSGFREASDVSGTNTPTTYLVIPPPYLEFTALSANAIGYLPYQIADIIGGEQVVSYMPVESNGQSGFGPFAGIADISINDMTFDPFVSTDMIHYVSSPAGPYELSVQGSNVTVTENTNGGATSRTIYDGPVQDISVGGEITDANIDILTATYSFGYGQNLAVLSGGPDISTSNKLYFSIQNAFMHDSSFIHVAPVETTQIAVYGTIPFRDNSGNYNIRAYKYVDSLNRNLGQALHDHSVHLNPLERYIFDLSFTDISSVGILPYTVDDLLDQLKTNTLTGKTWSVDGSYVPSAQFNFEFVALSIAGESLLVDEVFDISAGGAPVARVSYITLPDAMNVKSADGAPVMRITYNGSIVTPLVSTTQINLFNSNFTHQSSTINQEVLDYNVTALPLDISAN